MSGLGYARSECTGRKIQAPAHMDPSANDNAEQRLQALAPQRLPGGTFEHHEHRSQAQPWANLWAAPPAVGDLIISAAPCRPRIRPIKTSILRSQGPRISEKETKKKRACLCSNSCCRCCNEECRQEGRAGELIVAVPSSGLQLKRPAC